MQLVVWAEEQHVDSADHARDRLVIDLGEVLLAQGEELQVRRVAQVQELGVQGPDLIDVFQ